MPYQGEGLIIIYGELSCPGAAFFGGELTPKKKTADNAVKSFG